MSMSMSTRMRTRHALPVLTFFRRLATSLLSALGKVRRTLLRLVARLVVARARTRQLAIVTPSSPNRNMLLKHSRKDSPRTLSGRFVSINGSFARVLFSFSSRENGGNIERWLPPRQVPLKPRLERKFSLVRPLR